MGGGKADKSDWSFRRVEAWVQDEREFPLLAGTGDGDGISMDDQQEVLGSAAI